MIGVVVKRAWVVALLGVAAAVLLVASSGRGPESATASSPGATVSTLLSCPNVDGSLDDKVTIPDILAVVQAYFDDFPSTNYVYMYDLVGPYNPELGPPQVGGLQRIDDILAVVTRYFEFCPLVDTQVAKATRWTFDTDGNPNNGLQPVPVVENVAALAALGYAGGSGDVPGQGRHYIKFPNWLNAFDPAAPEGLVYDNARAREDGFPIGSCSDNVDNGGDGKGDTHGTFTPNPSPPPALLQVLPADPDCNYFTLAAQLYVVMGDLVGWLEDYNPGPGGSCHDGIDNGGGDAVDGADPDCANNDPSGQPLDDIDIDPLCASPGCSWAASEGWHLHYRLCTYHVGTIFAETVAMAPGSDTADCTALHDGTDCPEEQDPNCPGISLFNYKTGWMGHLWNHLPNPNIDADVGGSNGRFTDCYTDRFTNPMNGLSTAWKSFNCPQ